MVHVPGDEDEHDELDLDDGDMPMTGELSAEINVSDDKLQVQVLVTGATPIKKVELAGVLVALGQDLLAKANRTQTEKH